MDGNNLNDGDEEKLEVYRLCGGDGTCKHPHPKQGGRRAALNMEVEVRARRRSK